MAFDNLPSLRLTFDTDDLRINRDLAAVRLPSGRFVVLYEKELYSGRLSDSRTSFVDTTFNVNVEAGNGEINGTPVSWTAHSLVMPASTNQLIYVDAVGNVLNTEDYPMSVVKDVILLALVYVGEFSITSLEELEKWGRYVYGRRQIQQAGSWVWDDYEFILNTGEDPKAFYDVSSDKIYVTYRKDSSSNVRVLDVANELTWSYIPSVLLSGFGAQINMRRDPENEFTMMSSSSNNLSIEIQSDDFMRMGTTGLGYFLVGSIYEPFIYLPKIDTQYEAYVQKPFFYEIGYFNVNNFFVVEDTIPFLDFQGFERWYQWTGSYGDKYIRMRTPFFSLIKSEFVTPVSGYRQISIWPPFEDVGGLGTPQINVDSRDYVFQQGSGAASLSSVGVTAEFDQDFYTVDPDSFSFKSGSALSLSTFSEITAEFDQDFYTVDPDSFTLGSGSALMSSITITNS